MPDIAIVMAVYEPNIVFLEQQIQSIARQTFSDFEVIFVIADQTSKDSVVDLANTHDILFRIIAPPNRLNPVQAFEAGLQKAITTSANYIACCDQDDIWHKDRLAKGIAKLKSTGMGLVHSDAKLVDAQGKQIASSMFRYERRQKHPSLLDLLYRNTVTGMTTLATRDLIQAALPFPRQEGVHFYHDLWLALVAKKTDGLAFIDAPMVNYRQHSNNVVGVKLNPRRKRFRARISEYALARYLAETLVKRFGPHKKIAPFIHSKSWGWSHLYDCLRFILMGRFAQAYIALWFAIVPLGRRIWATRLSVQTQYQNSLGHFDNRLFTMSPGAMPPITQPDIARKPWWHYCDGRMSPKFNVNTNRSHPRTVIFVPTLNPTETFAGIATALDLGLGMVARGQPVTFIATDLPISNHQQSRDFLISRNKLASNDAMVDIVCGVTKTDISFHMCDQLIATAWWTAHLANTVIQKAHITSPFYYLIQDYEPCFYPWGTEYAYARNSYDLVHIPIFNSIALRDYFANLGICDVDALCFRPKIDVSSYRHFPKQPGPYRMAIYGRPEVARNLFPLKIAALGIWLESAGLYAKDIEIVSIGLKHEDIELPNGIVLKSIGKLPWSQYPEFLGTIDIGLSLMCSPHPSHPPIEMAAAGVQVVTNTFDSKNLTQISQNIHTATLDITDLIRALEKAWDCKDMTPTKTVDLTPLGPPLEDILDMIPHPKGTQGKAA